jgi:hypothetical protein
VAGRGQHPTDGGRIGRRRQLPRPRQRLEHRLRLGRRGRAREEQAGVGGLERGTEHAPVEIGEDLDHELVDHLATVELVDVDRHDVAVVLGDDGGHLGQRARQVGELHAEPVSAHPCTLPGPGFGGVAAGGTRGETAPGQDHGSGGVPSSPL